METDYRNFLREEFSKRLAQDECYSMKKFAREIGLSGPRLSEVLNGRQGLSQSVAKKLAEKIRLNATEANLFCDLIEMEHARSHENRELAKARVEELKAMGGYYNLAQDVFEVISDWYHLAILQVLELKSCQHSPSWIADKLGISTEEAENAIARLLRTGVLKKNSDGSLVRTGEWVSTTDGVPSQGIRKFHTQMLKKALTAIEEQEVERRNLSANFVSIRRKDLSQAKELIRRFRRKFTRDLAKPNEADSVYCLSIQLFDLCQDDE